MLHVCCCVPGCSNRSDRDTSRTYYCLPLLWLRSKAVSPDSVGSLAFRSLFVYGIPWSPPPPHSFGTVSTVVLGNLHVENRVQWRQLWRKQLWQLWCSEVVTEFESAVQEAAVGETAVPCDPTWLTNNTKQVTIQVLNNIFKLLQYSTDKPEQALLWCIVGSSKTHNQTSKFMYNRHVLAWQGQSITSATLHWFLVIAIVSYSPYLVQPPVSLQSHSLCDTLWCLS